MDIIQKHCLGPEECGKCLKVCPVGVFMKIPVGRYAYKREPKEYKVKPYFKELCNNCGACQRVCPTNCIRVLDS